MCQTSLPVFVRLSQGEVELTGSHEVIISFPMLTQRVKWLAADPYAGAGTQATHKHKTQTRSEEHTLSTNAVDTDE